MLNKFQLINKKRKIFYIYSITVIEECLILNFVKDNILNKIPKGKRKIKLFYVLFLILFNHSLIKVPSFAIHSVLLNNMLSNIKLF